MMAHYSGLRFLMKRPPLNDRLKSLGFSQGSQITLYGSRFEIMSEPIVMAETLVLIDAIEVKSGQFRRVRIPLPILKMAEPNRSAA
jgi:hypothetical protein